MVAERVGGGGGGRRGGSGQEGEGGGKEKEEEERRGGVAEVGRDRNSLKLHHLFSPSLRSHTTSLCHILCVKTVTGPPRFKRWEIDSTSLF